MEVVAADMGVVAADMGVVVAVGVVAGTEAVAALPIA
jgi:hypothetical protein